MQDDKSAERRIKTERRREFLDLLAQLPLADVLIIRALMLVRRAGRIFRAVDPITIGVETKKRRTK